SLGSPPRLSPGGGGSPGSAGSALSAPSGKIFERSGSRGFSFGSNGSILRSHAATASTEHAIRPQVARSEPKASEDHREWRRTRATVANRRVRYVRSPQHEHPPLRASARRRQ